MSNTITKSILLLFIFLLVVDHLKARIFVYLPRLWAKRKPALMRAYWLPKLTGGFS